MHLYPYSTRVSALLFLLEHHNLFIIPDRQSGFRLITVITFIMGTEFNLLGCAFAAFHASRYEQRGHARNCKGVMSILPAANPVCALEYTDLSALTCMYVDAMFAVAYGKLSRVMSPCGRTFLSRDP